MPAFTAPCVKCGKSVFMLRIKGTSVAAAFDAHQATEPYWTVDGLGYLERGGGFVPHTCDVGIIEQFRSTWLDTVNLANELNTAAYQHDCPKCGAKPGEKCINLMVRKLSGETAYTKNPHAERYLDDRSTDE